MFDAIRPIDPQKFCRRSSNGGFTDERGPVPGKMVIPFLRARIEQGNEFIGGGIKSRDVGAFRAIALGAAPTSIRQRISAPMFPRSDMVDFMRQIRAVFRQAAVFATSLGASSDLATERGHTLSALLGSR